MGGAVISVATYGYCREHNFSNQSASLVMTMYGVGSLLGSTFVAILSIVSNYCTKRLNRLYFHLSCNITMALMAVLVPVSTFSQELVTIYIFIIGAAYGACCANLGSMIEHLNGTRFLYLIYGYGMASAGLGSLIGPVVSAQLDTRLGSGSAFYFSGACIFAGFIVFTLLAMLKRSVLVHFKEQREVNR